MDCSLPPRLVPRYQWCGTLDTWDARIISDDEVESRIEYDWLMLPSSAWTFDNKWTQQYYYNTPNQGKHSPVQSSMIKPELQVASHHEFNAYDPVPGAPCSSPVDLSGMMEQMTL